MKKPRSCFYSFPKEQVNDYIHQGSRDVDSDTLEDLKNFSKAIMIPILPNKLIVETTKAKPLVAIAPLSFLVIVNLTQLLLPTLLPIAPATLTMIAMAPTHHGMPVHHMFATSAVSAKVISKLNGLSPATGTQTAKDY